MKKPTLLNGLILLVFILTTHVANSQVFQEKNYSYKNAHQKQSQIVKQRLDSLIIQEMNEESIIINFIKEMFSYNSQGILLEQIDSYWDVDDEEWLVMEKVEYIFNENDLLLQIYIYEWEEGSKDWIIYGKCEYSYDNHDNIVMELGTSWNQETSEFENDYLNEFTYDENFNQVEGVFSVWEENTKNWLPLHKRENEYINETYLLRATDLEWDNVNEQWDNSEKYEYTYEDWNTSEIFHFMWDGSHWVSNLKSEYLYDSYENINQILSYDWEEEIREWNPKWKEDLNHDNSYSFSDLILPYPFWDVSKFFTHQLLSWGTYEWTDEKVDWDYLMQTNYHYTEINVNSIVEVESDFCRVYPNPIVSYLFVESCEKSNQFVFELFNCYGLQIISMGFSNELVINLKKLNCGYYFYQIKSVNGIKQSGKLIS